MKSPCSLGFDIAVYIYSLGIKRRCQVNGHFADCNRLGGGCRCEIRRYWIVLGIVLVVLIAEVVGGFVSQSLALLADAGHVFVDTGAIVVVLVVSYLTHARSTQDISRIQRTGGYVNACSLLGISLWTGYEAIERITNPREITGWVMMLIAVFGALGNWVQHKLVASATEKNIVQESMRVHILSDFLQSVGVIVAGLAIWVSGYHVIDPMVSFFTACVMGKWTYDLFRKLNAGESVSSACGHVHH